MDSNGQLNETIYAERTFFLYLSDRSISNSVDAWLVFFNITMFIFLQEIPVLMQTV